MYTINVITLLLAASASVYATPLPYAETALVVRASKNVNPNAVTGTKCLDPSVNIVFHDENVAQLAICGSIAGAITKCQGNPASSSGASGTARFDLSAATAGETINVSKGRWEGCIRAARAVCPTGTFSSTCVGGASKGNVAFSLSGN